MKRLKEPKNALAGTLPVRIIPLAGPMSWGAPYPKISPIKGKPHQWTPEQERAWLAGEEIPEAPRVPSVPPPRGPRNRVAVHNDLAIDALSNWRRELIDAYDANDEVTFLRLLNSGRLELVNERRAS